MYLKKVYKLNWNMEFSCKRNTSRFLLVAFLYFMSSLGCSVSNQTEPSSIVRIPGDLNILAVLNYRESVDDFRCTGEFNHRVAYDVEALRFAAQSASVTYFENLGINLTLGLTVIDGCNNPVGTLRDVSYVLSDTAMDMNQASPTVGVLVPGSEDDRGVSELIFEEISRRLGILTIGYLPSLAIDVPSGDSPLEGADDTGAQMDENVEVGMIRALPLLTSAVPLTSETSALASILEEKSWFNVGLFYSGYGSGPSRRVAFLNSAGNVGACVSFERDIPYGLTQEAADDIVSDLFSSGGDIRVLVWIVSPEEIRLLLRSIRLRGNRFSNVGTSAWQTAIDNGLLDDGLLREANGTIFIDDVNCDVNRNFLTYISEQLDVDASIKDNPWLNRTILDGSVSEEDITASHTSSLIRAVEMIAGYINETIELACKDNSSLNQDCVLDFLASPNAPLLETVEQSTQNEEEISKTYCVLTLDPPGTNVAGIVIPGETDAVVLENLPGPNGIYRSDDCLCFIGGLEDRTGPSSDVVWLYDFSDPWIPAIFAVSLVFGLFALIMFFVLLFFWRYPVTQKSAIVANILLLLGIMMMYIMNIFYTRFPNELICGFQQFGTAFIHAWVFAALLVKCMATFATLETNEDLDTFQPKQRSNKLGPCVQLCAFMAFLAPQVALSVQWIVLTPPRVERDPAICGIEPFDCNVSNRKIVISMIYVFVLVSVTLIFSLARIKDGRLMQESRSLFLSSASSVLLMVAWMVCFVIADPIYQTPALCIGVTANATVILLSCFGPPCCVITYGEGTKAPYEEDKTDLEAEKEDRGDDIAYVNPAFLNNMEEHEETHL